MNAKPPMTLFGLGLLLLALGSCAPTTPSPPPWPPSPTPVTATWQRTVDALNALKPGEIPAHLHQTDAVRDGREFDPNVYFTVLTRLSLEPGYVLDYVYYFDWFAGLPLLYARPADQPPYANYAAYSAAHSTPRMQHRAYLEHVRTDGSPEGFFQLVLLSINGGQFYLHWHANYNDLQVVCDSARMEGIVALLQQANPTLSRSALRQLRALDYTPVVEFVGDSVRVRIVTFTMWGGFSEEVYILDRAFPHRFQDTERKVLVPYDCQIVF